jgi:hypothetical protein
MLSIETWWHEPVFIDPHDRGADDALISASMILSTRGRVPAAAVERLAGDPVVVSLVDDQGRESARHDGFERLPNAARGRLTPIDDVDGTSGHVIDVQTGASLVGALQDREAGAVAPLIVRTDGLVVLHWGKLGDATLTDAVRQQLGGADLLILPIDAADATTISAALGVVKPLAPRFVLPVAMPGADTPAEDKCLDAFVAAAADAAYKIDRRKHNTMAISRGESTGPTVVVLPNQPWKPTGELAALLDRLDRASAASQEVFAPLSVEQMNFRPANGTHTPRWNAEHMMGAQLLFFTQIYSRQDPAISPIALNPKQMPADYVAAHADWSGAEEARQMDRAAALVRRFAYLLDGLSLDESAPGSRWTLRRLCEQMERHSGEHTANVKKKFELADWPRD